MKRLKHLLEERSRVESEIRSIVDACEKESRSRTADEKNKYNTLKSSLDEILSEISFLQEQEQIDVRSAKPVNRVNEESIVEEASEKAAPSLRSQVEQWVKRNAETIKAIQGGEMRSSLSPLEIRAPFVMTVGAVNSTSSSFLPNSGAIQGGIVDLVRTQPTFWNQLTKGRTRLNPYVWANKFNKQGSADFIGEGVLKPLASFEIVPQSSMAKKVAERMNVSMELLNDVDGIVSLIEGELRYEVEKHANDSVITGVSSTTDPAGVTTLASAFTLTTVKTTSPNNLDAIRAAVAQLRSLGFTDSIKAFINPIDSANMDLGKGSDQHYLLPPFTAVDGTRIAGVQIIEDNNIAAGNLLIGDMTKYKILMYEDFSVRWGLNADDFAKNLITVIGEMRFHQYMSSNHAGAFIYDSFADIKAAILATP